MMRRLLLLVMLLLAGPALAENPVPQKLIEAYLRAASDASRYGNFTAAYAVSRCDRNGAGGGRHQLMVEFYKQLKAGQSLAQALNVAQQSLLKTPKYSHLYYWAPFVLLGDWR